MRVRVVAKKKTAKRKAAFGWKKNPWTAWSRDGVGNTDPMSDSFCRSVSDAIQTHQDNQIPVAKYDLQRGRVYYLHADGSRVYEEA